MTSTQQHTTIGSRVPISFAEQVRAAAEAEDRSIGSYVRRALVERIERHEPDHERQAA